MDDADFVDAVPVDADFVDAVPVDADFVDAVPVDADFVDAVPVDYLRPGETATVDVDGTPVTIANADGTWCAFESVCPHQATPLGGLKLMRRTLLQCPEHGSIFDVTTGQCVLPSDDGWTGTLRTYPTRVAGEVVAVSLR